jgi:ABC-type transporter Mla subunit MlaD
VSGASDPDRLATRVGGITLVVLAAAIAFFVFLLGRIDFGSHVRVRVYFHTTGGLREGAPFVVGGRAIGEVESIALVPRAPGNALGGDDGVVVTLAIASRYVERVPASGEIFVASRGPLSERYLEVAPPRVQYDDGTSELAAPGEPVREGQELRGIDPPSLDRVLEHTWDNLTTASAFLDDVRPAAHDFVAQLSKLGDNLAVLDPARTALLVAQTSVLIDQARTTWNSALGGDVGLARVAALIGQAQRTLADARAMLAVLQPRIAALSAAVATARGRLDAKVPVFVAALDRAIDQTRATLDKLDPMLATAKDLADRLARGEGSLGRLMTDPEFPEDAKELGKILKRQPWKIIGRPAN